MYFWTLIGFIAEAMRLKRGFEVSPPNQNCQCFSSRISAPSSLAGHLGCSMSFLDAGKILSLRLSGKLLVAVAVASVTLAGVLGSPSGWWPGLLGCTLSLRNWLVRLWWLYYPPGLCPSFRSPHCLHALCSLTVGEGPPFTRNDRPLFSSQKGLCLSF